MTLWFALLVSVVNPAWAASPKRERPDYDGRGGEPTTTGDALLWIPRVLLLPPYIVSEYLLRKPLGYVVSNAERLGLPALLYDFFAFGPDHSSGIVPTAYVDFGFSRSVGFYSFWNDAFTRGHDLRLRGGTWGKHWLSASFAERFHFGPESNSLFALEGSALRRPDYTFFGLGPHSRQADITRFGRDTLQLGVAFERGLDGSSSFRAGVKMESADFRPGFDDDDEEPSLDAAIALGSLPEPPGYRRGYTVLRSDLAVTFDTRQPRPAPGSGLRLSAEAGHASELRTRGSFLDYRVALTGYLDLNDNNRVLSLALATRFVDPLAAHTAVPFTELATLGGAEPMRGFYPGRLVGRSAAVADLAYRWPIWMWLDGSIHFEVGNVFGAQLQGIQPELLRWSSSLGIESTGGTDAGLQLLVGVGSETFTSGAQVDSLRLVVGTTHGF